MENKFQFQIKGIFVQEFSIFLKEEFMKVDQATKNGFRNYTFEVTCLNNVIIEDSNMNIFVNIKVFLDSEKKIELGHLSIVNVFFIKDIEQYYNQDTKLVNIPPMAEASIVGISISHSRAILLAKTAGTFLQNAVLPVLNPQDFLTKSYDENNNGIVTANS